MEILFFCFGSVVLSVFIDVKNNMRLHKDAADEGYKIDMKELSRINKEYYPEQVRFRNIIRFIQLCNIFQSLIDTAKYSDNGLLSLDQLRILGVLEEMSDIEKEEYAKKPTGYNAIKVPYKINEKIKRSLILVVNHDGLEGKIYYDFGDSIEKITIYKVTGNLDRLTKRDLKKEIIEQFFDRAKKRAKVAGKDGLEMVYGPVPMNNKVLESANPQNKESIEEAIRILENMKRITLESIEEEIKKEEKGRAFIKKYK